MTEKVDTKEISSLGDLPSSLIPISKLKIMVSKGTITAKRKQFTENESRKYLVNGVVHIDIHYHRRNIEVDHLIQNFHLSDPFMFAS